MIHYLTGDYQVQWFHHILSIGRRRVYFRATADELYPEQLATTCDISVHEFSYLWLFVWMFNKTSDEDLMNMVCLSSTCLSQPNESQRLLAIAIPMFASRQELSFAWLKWKWNNYVQLVNGWRKIMDLWNWLQILTRWAISTLSDIYHRIKYPQSSGNYERVL